MTGCGAEEVFVSASGSSVRWPARYFMPSFEHILEVRNAPCIHILPECMGDNLSSI